MKIAEYITQLLDEHKVNTLFGYIGGFNADILDYFCANSKNHFVLNYHEQASAFAINAYAVIKEQTGVATSSGAPSSCNLVAGIAQAYFDSNPCVFIVGSSHSLAVRKDKTLRQNTFEEIDMVHLVSDITKYAVRITDPLDVRYELEKAFYIANEGRKGPVLVDIPYDIARSEVEVETLRPYQIQKSDAYDAIPVSEIREILKKAQRPLLLLGGGARGTVCRDSLKKWLEKVKIPTVVSLCGLDVLPHNHECFAGFIGHYGNRYANLALANSDCVIVLGSRLDERQMGGYKSKLAEGAKLIRVDVDKAELGRKFLETLSIYSTTDKFLSEMAEENFDHYDFTKWLQTIALWKARYPSYDLSVKETNANNFLYVLSDYLSDDAIICADVGQNQMSVAQALRLDYNRRLLNSAGYGSMGYSLPAAVGAAYASPNTMILSVNGDGGIQMNIQELETLKRDNLPVNVIVLNNYCLGMLRRLQENMFDKRYCVSVNGYSVPDYEQVAKAYGIKYFAVKTPEDYQRAGKFLSDKEPTFIEVFLPQEMINYPEPGETLEKQKPLLSDAECEQIRKEIQ